MRSWPEATTSLGLLLRALEDDDLGLEFGDRLGGRGLVDEVLFERLLLVGVQVVVVLGDVVEGLGEDSLPAVAELLLAEPAFEPLLAAAERLVDGLRAGREPPLEGGEGEADRALALSRRAGRPCPSPSARSA